MFDEYEVNLHTYALSYLVNGDDSGINEDDKRIIDAYISQFESPIVSVSDGESFFTWHPPFGLACDVIECVILVPQKARKVGQIAEYGTAEYNDNKSVRTVLENGESINPHGIKRHIELVHMTQGYKMAGSCATWINEKWGVIVYYGDGTTGGQWYTEASQARAHFDRVNTL